MTVFCGDNSGMQESEQIAPMPQGIGYEEWSHIGLGLRQRMVLMEALALDLHGVQSLLQSGWVPAALAIGHGGHIPLLRGISPRGGRWLAMARFRIGHTPSGWQVLSADTRWPNPMPETLRQAIVAWSRSWVNCLNLNPNPAPWVLLDPQHHAPVRHVADHLLWAGPQDLEVHGTQLRLHGAAGVLQVTGLIHLGADGPVDPLEQNAPLSVGIAGLIQSWRLGQFAMLNAPGLSFLNTPAWLGFMGPLSKHLFQQDLLLPSLPTWWCGESQVLPQAMALWSEGRLFATFPDDGLRPAPKTMHGPDLSASQREAWLSTLQEHGEKYTIQAPWPRTTIHEVVLLWGPDGNHTMVWIPDTHQGVSP